MKMKNQPIETNYLENYDISKELKELKEWRKDKVNERDSGWVTYVSLIKKLVDFNDKEVLEFGARGGILGAYISDMTKSVVLTDTFEQIRWWKKGDERYEIKYWEDLWKKIAKDKSKIIIDTADITKTPYKDESFDIVMGCSVIEHVPDTRKALKECYRILKPGGLLCILTETADKRNGWVLSKVFNTKEFLYVAREEGFLCYTTKELKPNNIRKKHEIVSYSDFCFFGYKTNKNKLDVYHVGKEF